MLAVAYYLQTIKDRFAAADNERGATAVEYGLMVAAIAAVIVGIVFTLGGQVNTAFETVSNAITGGGTTTTN
ncbi:Flp family type IVb pilin [Ornithinicoccus halotolerans]|uniref:Flp family type IVb pilin n=1 Tax=Ornithinicoccus halotolerans TaxID=1748220 RepID=UPI001295A830|nr:Flp family type IVb pilin [Ornithinicoccus halotolerans]